MLRLHSSDDAQEASPDLVCSLDVLTVGESYTFDPPLPIAVVDFSSTHRLGVAHRKPSFLESEVRAAGLHAGRCVHKNAYDASGYGSAVFSAERSFFNRTTKQQEVARYTVICKFNRRAAPNGVRVDVRRRLVAQLQQQEVEE